MSALIPARRWASRCARDIHGLVPSLIVEATDPREGLVALSVVDGPATDVLSVRLTAEQYSELIIDGIRRLALISAHRAAMEAEAAGDTGS